MQVLHEDDSELTKSTPLWRKVLSGSDSWETEEVLDAVLWAR